MKPFHSFPFPAASARNVAALGSLMLLASCGPAPESRRPAPAQPPASADVLAQVGDQVITVTRFQAEWSRRPAKPGSATNADERQQLLEELIQFEVLLARAREAGLDREPEFQARVNRLLVARFQEQHLPSPEPAGAALAAAEVQARYEAEADRFTTPATTRWAVILLRASPKAEPARRDERRQQAEQIRREALTADAATFGRLAQRHSEDQASRYAGGDIGWIQADAVLTGWNAVLQSHLTRTSMAGGLTPVLEVPEGFLLARVADHRAAGRRPLAEVEDGIRYRLAREQQERQRTAQLQRLKAGLRINVNLPLLNALPAPAIASEPPRPPSPAG